MTEQISTEILAVARRRLCRRVGATIISAMAETDSSFALIARRLGKEEGAIRAWVYTLLDGAGIPLDAVSDLTFAMGCELTFQLAVSQPTENPAPAQSSADEGERNATSK